MDKLQLQHQIATSDRVRRIAAVAMQHLIRECYDVDLQPADAEALAESGDFTTAVEKFGQRARVQRARLTREEQSRLAAQQTALEASGADLSEVSRLIQARVNKAKDVQQQEDKIRRITEELHSKIKRYEEDSPKFKSFLRRIERVYRTRSQSLDALISESEARKAAQEELDDLYARHIHAAIELLECWT